LNGNVLYANAGHSSGLIIAGDDVTYLDPTGTILGPLPEIRLERSYGNIPPGGFLVLVTDGVTERVGPGNEPFGVEGLVELVKSNQERSAQELLDIIFETAMSLYHESDRLEDDVTVVVVKRNPIG